MTIPDEAREAMARAIDPDAFEALCRDYQRGMSAFEAQQRARDARQVADAALSALQSAGYAVVPVEATEEMEEAIMCKQGGGYHYCPNCSNKMKPRAIWSAMLAASQEKKT